MLARLERTQPVSTARIIALEEHVDYWNHLGWADPFSNGAFRVRQNDYGQFFRTENIYTPQMVVNGQVQFVGDDMTRAIREVGKAAVDQNYGVRLRQERNGEDPSLTDLMVWVRQMRTGKPDPAQVYLAVTETGLSSNVSAGENAGRLLRHAPVVRSFGVIGTVEPRPFREVGVKSTLKLPQEWKRSNLTAVVFIQERASRRISGTGTLALR
jgi:hypothetical protein